MENIIIVTMIIPQNQEVYHGKYFKEYIKNYLTKILSFIKL